MGFRFPNGVVGAAYLLMRIQAAVIIFQIATSATAPLPLPVTCVVVAALATGCLTRAVSLLCSVMLAAHFLLQEPSLCVAVQVMAMIVVALVGAGAYSIDRVLFGHHVIRLGQ